VIAVTFWRFSVYKGRLAQEAEGAGGRLIKKSPQSGGKHNPAVNSKLLINVVQMNFHGAFAQVELTSNRFIRKTVASQFGDLTLSVG
jgi:hypothetical protein